MNIFFSQKFLHFFETLVYILMFVFRELYKSTLERRPCKQCPYSSLESSSACTSTSGTAEAMQLSRTPPVHPWQHVLNCTVLLLLRKLWRKFPDCGGMILKFGTTLTEIGPKKMRSCEPFSWPSVYSKVMFGGGRVNYCSAMSCWISTLQDHPRSPPSRLSDLTWQSELFKYCEFIPDM